MTPTMGVDTQPSDERVFDRLPCIFIFRMIGLSYALKDT
jgi:hypothetical protein